MKYECWPARGPVLCPECSGPIRVGFVTLHTEKACQFVCIDDVVERLEPGNEDLTELKPGLLGICFRCLQCGAAIHLDFLPDGKGVSADWGIVIDPESEDHQ